MAAAEAAEVEVRENVRVTANLALFRGGGVCWVGGAVAVTGTGFVVEGTRAGTRGGGVFYATQVEMRAGEAEGATRSEVVLQHNSAGGEGGGLCGDGWRASMQVHQGTTLVCSNPPPAP